MFGGKIRLWVILCACALVLLGATFASLTFRAHHMEQELREKIEQELSARFESKVELKALHVHILPRIGVVGEGHQDRGGSRREAAKAVRR